MLPWPYEPFGPVGEVLEASGTEDEVVAALDGCALAVTQMAPFTRKVLEASPDLRWIGVCRGGPVNVNLAAATEAGVAVSFAPGRNAQAAAEFALALILGVTRRVTDADRDLREGRWRGDLYAYDRTGPEIAGSTVGLVGYGAIGSIVASTLRHLGATVLVHDPYADPARLAADGVEGVELEDLLRRSSIVSLHARVTPETRGLMDRDRLALLPRGAFVVNTARGELLDYSALPELLDSGALGGVALDVYDVEPPAPDWELLRHDRVITTPHLAGASRQTAQRAARITAAEAGRFQRGEPLLHLANPEVMEVLA